MKTRKQVLVLVVLLLLVFMRGQAGADFKGNHLVQLMREYEKSKAGASYVYMPLVFEYMQYVNGVFDTLRWFGLEVPDDVTPGQIFAIVAKYLNNHPEKWNEQAVILVVEAITEAFPQKKKLYREEPGK
jgi:hypothetical protein